MPQLTPEQQFEDLKRKVVETLPSVLSIDGPTKVIVHGVEVEDNLSTKDLRSQKEAVINEKTWSVPVYADMSIERGGRVLDRKRVQVMSLPKTTDRYGYIIGGTEYQSLNQFRQKSGVYHRVTDDGQIVAEFNLHNRDQFVAGKPFKLVFNPTDAVFYLHVKTSDIPAYHLLKNAGVSDEDMQKTWGKEIWEKNKAKDSEARTLRRFNSLAADDAASAGAAGVDDKGLFAKLLKKTVLFPDTTKKTLGKAYSTAEPETLMRSSEQLLGISRGTREPDDKHSLEFNDIFSIEDLISERLDKNAKAIQRKMLNSLSGAKKTVKGIVPTELLDRSVSGFFRSSVASLSEQTNPLAMINGQLRTTIMGDQGGIKSAHAVSEDAKLINPSHLGFLDPIHTPEGEKTGISLSIPLGVQKKGNTLYATYRDAKTGKRVEVNPAMSMGSSVAFSDQYRTSGKSVRPVGKRVKVIKDGEITYVSPSEVDYIMPSPRGMFDAASNMIPFLQNDQGNRAMTASRQQEQAVPLVHREAPLVQVRTDGAQTFEELLGHAASHRSTVDGTVESVRDDAVIVKDRKGNNHEVQVYRNFPLEGHTLYDSEVLVKAGDKVKSGQVLADTTYSKGGTLSLGTNLYTAYLPMKGWNFEDGIVISDSAAKKLTSAHSHRKDVRADAGTLISKKAFMAHYPHEYNREQVATIGDDGVVAVGTKVRSGDPMVLTLRKPQKDSVSMFAAVRRGRQLKYKDASQSWDSEYEGTVTNVVHHDDGNITVHVKTEEPAQVGDKLVGRHGNKGIITRILHDSDMPYSMDAKGEKRPVQIALNPLGIPGRINLGQVLETVAGKAAEKQGTVYKVKNFEPGKDYLADVKKDLSKAGVTDKDTIYDPDTGKALEQEVLTGNQYILKLKHQVGKKIGARSGGPGMPYNINHSPTSGPPYSGMSVGELGLYALLAHGARENIHDMFAYKANKRQDGQGNDAFWNSLREGTPIPAPQVPFVYDKFLGYLNGMRVNVKKDGNSLQLLPFTEKQIVALSSGELKEPGLDIIGKNAKPETGGIFDERITGGLEGKRWSHFKLAEPIPNPLFEDAIKHLTGMNDRQFTDTIRGDTPVDGKHGGYAIEALLKKIDPKKEQSVLEEKILKTKGDARNRMHRKLRILKALNENDLDPTVYMMQSVPVMPPVFRPLTIKEDGDRSNADLNFLYKDIAAVNQGLRELKKESLPDSTLRDTRESLYDGVAAMMGMGTNGPLTREYAGIADIISGKRVQKGSKAGKGRKKEGSPKEGYFHKAIMHRKQDFTGRSTIVPEPRMGLDELGLPEDIAWTLYSPFVQRELARTGMKNIDIVGDKGAIAKRTPMAEKALLRAMDDRPLLLKRDPVLHKFNVMAFKPRLVRGKAIEIHPLITSSYNADFDGDAMSVFLPTTPGAVKESYGMFPSNNLFSPTTGAVMYTPGHEALLGLYLASLPGSKTTHTFASTEALLTAQRSGKVKMTDVVKVGGHETTAGRVLIESVLPTDLRETGKKSVADMRVYDKKMTQKVLTEIGKKYAKEYGGVANGFKDLGNDYSYKLGYSVGLSDFTPINVRQRDSLIAKAEAGAARIQANKTLSTGEKRKRILASYSDVDDEIDKLNTAYIKKHPTNISRMIAAGARGEPGQLKQIVSSPILVKDAKDRVVPYLISKSYAEGMDVGSYWTTLHGARKGTLQKSQGTAEPGYMSKLLVNSTINQLVTAPDCGTKDGVHLSVDDNDVLDRYLSKGVSISKKSYPAGTLVTPSLVAAARASKIGSLDVRSPMRCTADHGVCQRCMGIDVGGKVPEIGTNIGVIAAQSIGEPSVQMSMKVFHSGGLAKGQGSKSMSLFDELNDTLKMHKKVVSAATLAATTGNVTDVKEAPQGGYYIRVGDGPPHYVPATQTVSVAKGSKVEKGQTLSSGTVDPRQLLVLKGMRPVQDLLADKLQGLLHQVAPVKRRNIEVVVKAATDLVHIDDPGGNPEWTTGDMQTYPRVRAWNAKNPSKPAKFTPELRSIEQVPLEMQEDWVARMNSSNLTRTLVEASREGWKSDIAGFHPVPSIAHAKDFGKSKERLGKDWKGQY